MIENIISHEAEAWMFIPFIILMLGFIRLLIHVERLHNHGTT